MFNKTVFQWLVRLLFMGTGLFFTSVQAAPSVQCRISSSGEMRDAAFSSFSDPLSTTATDMGNGFRFSGVLLESPLKFKSYVYYESKDRYVLIARQEFLLDSRQCNTAMGLHEVYSAYLENHLTYECTATCSEKPAN